MLSTLRAAFGGAVSSRSALWPAFVLVHLVLALLGLYGAGLPLGDVLTVYPYWAQLYTENGYLVGVHGSWVYPLLAILPILAATLLGYPVYVATWLCLIIVLNAIVFGAITARSRGRRGAQAGWWWLLFLLALGPIALGRIDSVTVPVAMLGMLLLAQRPAAAGVMLAAATWIKVWPAALLFSALVAVRGRLRVLLGAALVCLVVLAVALGLGGGTHVLSFMTLQSGRGLQVEAVAATPWLWAAAAGVPGTRVYYDDKILTWQVEGPGVEAVASVTTPLMAGALLALLAVGAWAVRRAGAGAVLAPLALSVVTVLIVANKVGSPQFIAWLAVPLALGLLMRRRGQRGMLVAAALGVAIAALTHIIYPYLYGYLIGLFPAMIAVITLRGVLLIALLVGAVTLLVRRGLHGHRAGLGSRAGDNASLPAQ